VDPVPTPNPVPGDPSDGASETPGAGAGPGSAGPGAGATPIASDPDRSNDGGPLAFTGADLVPMGLLALALLVAGGTIVWSRRRSRRN